MTDEHFWRIIRNSKIDSEGNMNEQLDMLANELSKLPLEEIIDFDIIFRKFSEKAFTWELWGAAHIISGGCSNDDFSDFRNWLISMGKDTYYRALTDPDFLSEIEIGSGGEEHAFFEEFGYVAGQVYEEKSGEDLPYPDKPFPTTPTGTEWDEDSDYLQQLLPKLWAKYAKN